MDTRMIGSLSVSSVGLGCNNFGMRIEADAADAVVRAALDAGITFFDTADIYGGTRSEEMLGASLKGVREDVVIATKFGGQVGDAPGGASPDYVRQACDASLKRLQTDWIDLYQLHFPDDGTPIEDTLAALDDLRRAGKVREIGCSNFDGALADAATEAATGRGTARFVSIQNHLNLLHRNDEEDLLAAADRNDLAILPYFPLASGMLTGKYRRGDPPPEGSRLSVMPEDRREQALADERFDVVEQLEALAAERDRSLLELAMAWLAGLPRLASVIAGATTPEQARSNAAAASWDLTDEDRAAIDRITKR